MIRVIIKVVSVQQSHNFNDIYEVGVYLYNVIIVLKYQANNLNTDIR
jgi:hypothetical protein